MFTEFLHIFQFLRHPDASVVAQRFAHQRQFALLVAVDRNTGRMDLREAGIAEKRSFPIALHGCGTIAVHRVRRKEISISIAAGGNDHGMGAETLQRTRDEVARDDTLRLAVDEHQIQHLMARIGFDGTGSNLLIQGSISTQQQLLSGLSASIEGAAHLHAAKRPVRQVSAVFTGKRNPLRHTLVDNGGTYFRKTIYIRFTRTIVSALDRVIEKTIDGVVVILVILGRIDTSLRRNRVGAARRIADTEDFYIVSQFTQGCGCRCSSKTGTHHDHLQFTLVVRAHETDFRLAAGPLVLKRSGRNFGI